MTKRKHFDDSIEECKRFRDEQFSVDYSHSGHEKKHLLYTNNTLANFVRNSVDIMVFQRDEIENLNLIINQLRQSLAISESKNFTNHNNMNVL